MRHQDRVAVTHKRQRPPGIRSELPGGSHNSSSYNATNLGEHYITRDWLHAPGTHLVTSPNHLCRPNALYLVGIREVKTLDNPFRKECS